MLQAVVGMELNELRDFLGASQPAFRARQIYQALYQRRIEDFSSISNIPNSLRERLKREARTGVLPVASRFESADGTRRYLLALETEDFSVFPAPVYARGFLRTYSRYLGLNPDELIRVFPNGNLTVDITPLPSVSRPPARMINFNWVVAALVAVFLVGALLLLLNSGDDTPLVATPSGQNANANQPTTTQGGTVQAPPAAQQAAPVQGKAIAPIRPGEYPDFVGADLPSAQAVCRENQMNCVIVQLFDRSVPRDIVIRQTPGPGSKSGPDSSITLYVSKGPPQ